VLKVLKDPPEQLAPRVQLERKVLKVPSALRALLGHKGLKVIPVQLVLLVLRGQPVRLVQLDPPARECRTGARLAKS
jgi:hypothetical protein